jgi:photosystem II stability/assembly factor-like uncharacterized protein
LPAECGTVLILAAAPTADQVIAGIAGQGLWAAGNDDQWSQLGTGSGSTQIDNRPFSVTFDPAHAETFWESGGYHGRGAFRTDDSGATFHVLGDITHIQKVAVDFTDPQRATLLASGHEYPALLRSTDGGTTWTDLTSTLPASIGFPTGIAVLDAQTFLLGTSQSATPSPADGVYRSTDAGATWTQVFPAAVLEDPLTSAVDGSMFWTLADGKGIIRSTDQGATWTRVNATAVVSFAAAALTETADGTLLGVGRSQLIASTDRGVTWRSFGPPLPFPPTTMTYSAARNAVYIAYKECDLTMPTQPVAAQSVQRLDLTTTS